MSLYYEAAPFLLSQSNPVGSLKSKVYNSKDIKSQPKQVYALVSEASKWSAILTEVIEKSQILQSERKLSPHLALLLVHDLFFNKRGISAPKTHPLRVSVVKHKARLRAELTKARLKRGCASVEDLRAHIEAGNTLAKPTVNGRVKHSNPQTDATAKHWPHPRWVRVNTIKTNLEEQLKTTFAGYESLESLEAILNGSSHEGKLLHIDKHIPNLLALPPSADFSKTSAYFNGLIIFQDKASCFPAYLLDPDPEKGDYVDACAGPGNKTTHLAAITHDKENTMRIPVIFACERNNTRALTLERMIQTAGANNHVVIKARQDFLNIDHSQPPWNGVAALLLDPSCSGSGIVGRDLALNVVLPSKEVTHVPRSHSKKRKRKASVEANPAVIEPPETVEEIPLSGDEPSYKLATRLAALSNFQLKLLLHAFEFPRARKITYSTCSIYAEENEHVVMKALNSPIVKRRGWRILKRDEQISGTKIWDIRGDVRACRDIGGGENATQIAEACIRCEKGTNKGTQGFFVAAFVRDGNDENDQQSSEEQWEGFSDSDSR